ncbi:MAG: PCI domain-containing protein [archaeon]|nr:PCI domain-containing protein [archaeon]
MLSESILKDVELKKLIEAERTARLNEDFLKSKELCQTIVKTLYERGDFEDYLKATEYLAQRKNQSREAIISIVKYALDEILPQQNKERQVALLDKMITITEGKIFVETEYSEAVKRMADIYIQDGDLAKAAKIVQDVQIEAFGSLDRRYKTRYILYQMEILLKNNDFIRMLIVSNKINRTHLDDEGFEELKVDFYLLMINYYKHEKDYLQVSKCFKILFDFLKKIQKAMEKPDTIPAQCVEGYNNSLKKVDIRYLFENFVLFLSICPPEKETKNMFFELNQNYRQDLDQNVLILNIVLKRLSDDLIVVNGTFLNQFKGFEIFQNEELFKLFRKYWIQHDLLIYEKFYSRIQLNRMWQMINIPTLEIENEIADMVINQYIYAKINRIEQTVNFRKKEEHHDIINNIKGDLDTVLKNLENTCHLINKEYLKHGIKK